MDKQSIINHIEIRKKQLEDLKWTLLQLESLKEEVGFSEKTWNEIQAKTGSRFAYLERSILDHEKHLNH